jgi:hypothetical protein
MVDFRGIWDMIDDRNDKLGGLLIHSNFNFNFLN